MPATRAGATGNACDMKNRKSKTQNPKSRRRLAGTPDLRPAFTLVEVLIAATLSLVLVGLAVQIFATVGNTAAETRSVIQMNDRLRSARIMLQTDLGNTTVRMLPLQPGEANGYFEYVEGPDGPIFKGIQVAFDVSQATTSSTGGTTTTTFLPDTTVGDPDDILMFTTNAPANSNFTGRVRYLASAAGGLQVPVDALATASTAEICYFVRGGTLYRRMLMVKPEIGDNGFIDPALYLWSCYPPAYQQQYQPGCTGNIAPVYDISFYDKFDVSARQIGGPYDLTSGTKTPGIQANTLADLGLRQNRYGHQPWVYPYDVRFWDARNWTLPATNVPGAFLGLPTIRECTFYTGTTGGGKGIARWPFPFYDPNTPAAANLWGDPQPSGSTIVPYKFLKLIYPYPTTPGSGGGTAAQYQPGLSPIPGSPTGHIRLTNNSKTGYDLWENPYPLDQQDPVTGSIYAFSSVYQPAGWVNVDFSTRYSDDILLQHVLSFDVKAWDPTAPTIQITSAVGGVPPGTYTPDDPGHLAIINTWATSGVATLMANLQPASGFVIAQGAYVDLNYLGSIINNYLGGTPADLAMVNALSAVSTFSGPGIAFASSGLGMVYDTGSFTYENDGIDQNQNGIIDDFTNGLDDNGIGGVDDLTEVEGPTPYPVPLKGIQIRIRVFDPDSRQIREVTVTEDFLYD